MAAPTPVPTPSAPPAAGPYSPAVRAGGWIVLSGQLGLGADGVLVRGGIEAEADQALANVGSVLADCGADWADVARVGLFLTDLSVMPAVNERYEAALGVHRPARTTIGVAALPMGAAIEVEAWVWRPGNEIAPATTVPHEVSQAHEE
jgi:2-iminobutanoate/2-iminopropanoate deaminase